MARISPAMKVGIIARRHPETEEVFEWHDIDIGDRRHTTLAGLAEELDIDVEILIDELTECLMDEADETDEAPPPPVAEDDELEDEEEEEEEEVEVPEDHEVAVDADEAPEELDDDDEVELPEQDDFDTFNDEIE